MHFPWPLSVPGCERYFHLACGTNSYVALWFFSCPHVPPYICIISYRFDAFLYITLHFICLFFWCSFTRDISETWIPLVFIFSWFWPPLYYLFHVFSMVNIYKTLSKLFKIAFHNFPLPCIKDERNREKRHSDSPCVTEYVNSLS